MNKYIKIEFGNPCDIPPLYLTGGFFGIIYLEGELNESEEDRYEEGEENGYGDFYRTFQRSAKRYVIRTGLLTLPQIERLHQLRFFDVIELTTPTGEVMDIFRVDFEHDWRFEDKTYGTGILRFDMDEVIKRAGVISPKPAWQWLTGEYIKWQDGTKILHQ